MSKQMKSLAIALGCLVVLAGALVAVRFLLKSSEPQGNDPLDNVADLINVVSGSSEDIEHITVKNPSGEYSVIYRKDSFGAKVWYIEDLLEAQPVSGSGSAVASACANINAEEQFENVTDLAQYGLDSPKATAEVKYSDGSSRTVYFGSAVPSDGGYYMNTSEDKGTVYVLSASSSDVFFRSLGDFLNLQITAYEDAVMAGITRFQMEGALLEEPIDIVKPSEESEIAKLGFNLYDIVSPIRMEMKADVTTNLTRALMGVTAESVVAVHPTEEELATYGMAEPQYVLTVTHPDWEEPLVLKTSRVNGITYLMKNREPVIFSMGSTGVLWHGWQLEDMMSNMVIMPRLGDLKTVRVTLEGTTYEFAVETAISEEKGTEGQMMPTKVTLDGRELNLDNFKVFYQLMLNCVVNSRSDGAETEEAAVLTYEYVYRDGKSDVVAFIPAGNRRMYLALNGAPDYFIKDTYYDKVAEELPKLLSDQQVSIDWN